MLTALNPEQHRAVVDSAGPMLVIAGAGSGKTRVLTTRIAWLIREGGVRPENILAFTFTNKAAREMRDRVQSIVPEGRGSWIGTFHATGVRILRREAQHLGLNPDFSIYDSDDSKAVIKKVLKARHADPKDFTPRGVAAAISHHKNHSMSPESAQADAVSGWEENIAQFYADYERHLRASQALDFDDLIGKTVELLENHPEVQQRYAQRFQHVLVDEFQDTNPLQLILTKALSAVHGNLLAVGDDDQSIYSWRGATVENMLEFEDYFPGARVLRLEQNYRSTGTILRAANEVIGHNRRRRGKKLWTESEAGEALELLWLDNEEGEAEAIRGRIEAFTSEEHYRRQDCVVLYRTNAQSRALEDALRRGGLPYQIVGGTRFYDRREVRDLLAYLKLVVNPDDAVSFERVVNVPRRGIGKTSLERLLNAASERNLSPLRLCREQAGVLVEVCGKAPSKRILAFVKMITELSKLVQTQTASWILRQVLDTTKYEDWLQSDDPSTADDRRENVQELLNAAQTFVAESDEGRLADFLESVALLADVDRMEAGGDMVTLMTVHTAKGLEYPVVFVAGCEENLLPHANSIDEDDKLEEERRLFYVALTRAKKRVVLSAVSLRRRFGGAEPAMPSRFLSELPEDAVVERGERTPAYAEPSWSANSPQRRRMYSEELPGGRPSAPRRRVVKRSRVESQDHDAAGGGVDAYGAAAFLKSRAKQKSAGSSPGGEHGFEDHEFSQEEQQFKLGERVRHATLGEGTIVAVEGFGELTKLTIDFADAGRKRVLARYARLEMLSADSDLPF